MCNTYLCTLFPPRKEVRMMFTRPYEHNRLLREVKCVYQLMDSTCASVTGKDDYIMFRCVDSIAENVACLVPK
jgi:hypothetical protein